MNSFSFKIEGESVYLVCGDNKKTISKEIMLETCYLLLGNIAEQRDYSSVTSLSKLLRIINIECEPDTSDDEKETPTKPPATATVATIATVASSTAKRPAPVRKAPATKTVAPPAEDSEASSD